MQLRKTFKPLIIAAIIILLNVFLNGFYQYSIDRPLIYYEYILLPFVLVIVQKRLFRIGLLFILIALDTLMSLSRLYYFDSINYLFKFPSLFITQFSFLFWLKIIIGLAFFIFILYKIITIEAIKTIKRNKEGLFFSIRFFIVSFAAIFIIDYSNGTSFINFTSNRESHLNVSKALISKYYNDINNFKKEFLEVHQIDNFENSSIAYKYLSTDSSAHQLLILVESWGLMMNKVLREKQIASLLTLSENGFEIIIDSSRYGGGTTHAEARELLNKKGEAYYSILQNNTNNFNSLVSDRNRGGYKTAAFQSFSGYYSSGNRFRTLIGFNEVKDYDFFKKDKNAKQNYNNQYESVNESLIFEYAFENCTKHKKTFSYILTINSHLPFNYKKIEEDAIFSNFDKKQYSDELIGQYYCIKNQMDSLSLLLRKYPITTLILVGDHPPPFITNQERAVFRDGYVPALIIKRKKD